MNVAFINPFIEATVRSLEMMAGIEAERSGLAVKEDLEIYLQDCYHQS